MIAEINPQCDISIYLNENDVQKCDHGQEVTGILVRRPNYKEQGKITIIRNDEKKNLNGFGIGIDDSQYWEKDKLELAVFVGDYYWQRFIDYGVSGTRQRMLDGSKIDLQQATGIDFRVLEMMIKDEKSSS